MILILLIILFTIANVIVTNDPILIASPYPFNTSAVSQIECFSNDQGIILSLTIIATMLVTDKNTSSLQSTKDNIIKNGSVILTISAPFNYSQLHSKIECRSKYHHGAQQFSQLEVLSVAEISDKEHRSVNSYTNQMIALDCRTYGTAVLIHWDFTRDISKNTFSSLPHGIRFDHKFTLNDTLIIEHVSDSDHHGYYRCYATNKLLSITYEDQSVIYLTVKKNSIWIPIVIISLVVMGICILFLIFCSKYCQKKREQRLAQLNSIPREDTEIIEKIKQIVPNRQSMEVVPQHDSEIGSERVTENIGELNREQKNMYILSHSDNSTKSRVSLLSRQRTNSNPLSISKISPQFVLGNPFLDPNVQSINSNQQHISRLNNVRSSR